MRLSGAAYEKYALEHPDENWELHCGVLRKKPPMTWEHNQTARNLGRMLERQLSLDEYEIIVDMGRVKESDVGYYIPDVYVVPREMLRRLFRPKELEAYPEPLPLVVEVWSRSTGRYNVRVKLEEYRRRGDAEIWFVHPYRLTVTVWRRRPDGTYDESMHTNGEISPASLPGVTVPLNELFRVL